MSQILEYLRDQVKDQEKLFEDLPPGVNRSWTFSFRCSNSHAAMINSLVGQLVENKTDAITLLLDLGFEAIEKDGVFKDVLTRKDEFQDIYDWDKDK